MIELIESSLDDIKGLSLIELMVSLLVLSFVILPFLSMFTQFTALNKYSREGYLTAIVGQNEIEAMKELTLPELVERAKAGLIKVDDFYIDVKIVEYYQNEGSSSGIQLVFNQNADGENNCYIKPAGILLLEELYNNLTVSEVLINIRRIEDKIYISLDGESGSQEIYIGEYTDHNVFHVDIYGKSKDMSLIISFDGFDPDTLNISVYDNLYDCSQLNIYYEGSHLSYEYIQRDQKVSTLINMIVDIYEDRDSNEILLSRNVVLSVPY